MARPPYLTTREFRDFTPEVLQKLDDAFAYGLSIEKACLLAGVSESLYYQMVKKNPRLIKRFDWLKNNPKVQAIKNIVNDIEKGEVETSKWYLERKMSKEFGRAGENVIPPQQQVINIVVYGEDDRLYQVLRSQMAAGETSQANPQITGEIQDDHLSSEGEEDNSGD